VLLALKGQGAPEVEQAYRRAHALCRHVEETEQLVPVLVGLRMWYFARAELQVAHELSAHLLRLAPQAQEPALLLEAHRSVGMTQLLQGAFAVARVHLEQGIALATSRPSRVPLVGQHGPMPGMLPAVACLAYASWVLWALGYADQALRRGHEALALAQTLANPFSVGTAMNTQAVLHLFRGEVQAASQHAEAALTLATDHEFAHIAAAGMIRRGGALIGQGRAAEGIVQLIPGLEASRAIGWLIFQPYYLSLLATAYGHVGQPHEGLRVLAEALAAVDKIGECWWQAELHRLMGELTLQPCVQAFESRVPKWRTGQSQRFTRTVPDPQSEAESCFHQALEVTRHQQAKSLELRAAMSLSRLWQQQGKRAQARQLLASIYSWFTEGHDTADLQAAKALLEALA
jgi:predicted ATPase